MLYQVKKQLLLLTLLFGMSVPVRAMEQSDPCDSGISDWLTWRSGAAVLAGAGVAYCAYNHWGSSAEDLSLRYPGIAVTAQNPMEWDWSKIDVNDVQFPKQFGWGAATSAFQIEGDQTAKGKKIKNSWTESERAPKAGIAAGHWDRFREDVQLIKQAGLTEYRFSIKWSAVEPEQGVFDADAMQHYVDLVDELNANGIKPFVMLFHHAWPAWFGELGDFQKPENSAYFIEFADYVFNALKGKVRMWMTFNEPAGYCLSAYFMGDYPPYVKNLKTTGTALKAMIDTHAVIYHRFKRADPKCQVGLAKMFVPLDPYPSSNPAKKLLSTFICFQFGGMQNNVVLDYLNTGIFDWGFPLYGRVTGENREVKGAIDFIGVNYYSNVMIDGTKRTTVHGRVISDAGKAVYAEGLMRSIELCAERLPGVAMWIGENGIADAGDQKREDYFKKHLWVVSYALKKGYDIRGYHVWTLLDSFNWKTGFMEKYGMYEVDFDTLERALRPGARCVVNLAKNGAY